MFCHHWERHAWRITGTHTLRSTGTHTDSDRHRRQGTHLHASPHGETLTLTCACMEVVPMRRQIPLLAKRWAQRPRTRMHVHRQARSTKTPSDHTYPEGQTREDRRTPADTDNTKQQACSGTHYHKDRCRYTKTHVQKRTPLTQLSASGIHTSSWSQTQSPPPWAARHKS